jgi:hypothetical protein
MGRDYVGQGVKTGTICTVAVWARSISSSGRVKSVKVGSRGLDGREGRLGWACSMSVERGQRHKVDVLSNKSAGSLSMKRCLLPLLVMCV